MADATGPLSVALVVPTIGRPSLAVLLEAMLREGADRLPAVVLVDDRPDRSSPLLSDEVARRWGRALRVVAGRARGPATARNIGWRSTSTEWVAFVDDDVVPRPGWLELLHADLAGAEAAVAAVQGRVHVPLPTDRPPTDRERDVAGLERARWATADMAFRREALFAVGGFDERFERAYREDADLALRLLDAGWRLERGRRRVDHPVGPAPWHVSVGRQRGNAEDPFMAVLHGPGWRRRAGVPRGRRRRHLAVVGAALVGLAGLARGRRGVAAAGALGWAAGTVELAWARIAPGPRTAAEVGAMAATSAVLPPVATWHWLRGLVTVLRRSGAPAASAFPDAVLFDRDGTLVDDVPYNGDPAAVRLRPDAADALRHLRTRGVPVGLVTNQSGIARGVLTPAQVEAVNRRVAAAVGGFDVVQVCPHGPDDGCRCRKPAPGMVLAAARVLGVEPSRCVVIGDIGADVEAAAAAGARGILVPDAATRPEEVAAAAEVAPDLGTAVLAAIGGAVLASPVPVPVPPSGAPVGAPVEVGR